MGNVLENLKNSGTKVLENLLQDDYSAKIWSVKQDEPLYDLRTHTKEIYTIKVSLCTLY